MVQGPLQPQNPKNKDTEDPLNDLNAILKWHIKQINKIEGDFDNKWMPVKHFLHVLFFTLETFSKICGWENIFKKPSEWSYRKIGNC